MIRVTPRIFAQALWRALDFKKGSFSSEEILQSLAVMKRYGLKKKLKYILKYLEQIEFTKKGMVKAEVTTAKELSQEAKEKIGEILAAKDQRKLLINFKVSPEIIGGVILEKEGLLWDDSAISKIKKL